MSSYRYVGEELDVFSHARNWKAYLRSALQPYLKGDVLEVGAGIGSTTLALYDGTPDSWTCIEPDAALVARARARLQDLPKPPVVAIGTTGELARRTYDAVLYVDVLEHIEDDREELREAGSLLAPGGALVVLSPAHQWLFTAFDARIGHCRRYDARMLREQTPPGVDAPEIRYLDAAGMLLSLGNRVLLRSAEPTLKQVLLWDRYFVTASRRIDGVLGGRVGKSVLAVWRRPGGA